MMSKKKTLRGKKRQEKKMFIQEDDLKLNDWQFSQRKYTVYYGWRDRG